jgi:hypothetical protein
MTIDAPFSAPRRARAADRVRSLAPFVTIAAIVAAPVFARRAPGPGGTATIAVPAELVPAVVEAHLHAPLVVPMNSDEPTTERPPLPGAEGAASLVLQKVSVDGSGRRWRLSSTAPGPVAASVERCLAGRAAGGFAAAALRAVDGRAEVVVDGDDVVVTVFPPVFVLPALLSYCPFVGAQGAPTGAFSQAAPGRLAWRSGSFEPAPLLGAVEIRGTGGGNDTADVAAMAGAGGDEGGATLLAPWSDVVLLVQDEAARTADPFGLADPRSGRRAFIAALRPDLLAAAWAAGRGGPTDALLPPGVAPARPLPAIAGGGDRPPLTLTPLASSAPRLPLFARTSDAITDGVAERLAVVLRARGIGLDVQRALPSTATSELVRWRPPARDAALALLAFLGERPGLLRQPAVVRALDAGALLAADPATRLRAALALERALLEQRFVVPLLVVDRWLTVDPDLRGVGIRDDGVPLLEGAWWGGGR